MRWLGLTSSRVAELWMPPRLPRASARGTATTRSWAWYMYTVPAGIRLDTTARATTTPLRLTASIHSLSRIPTSAAPDALIQIVGPPRARLSISRLSWYSGGIDHLEGGGREREVRS